MSEGDVRQEGSTHELVPVAIMWRGCAFSKTRNIQWIEEFDVSEVDRYNSRQMRSWRENTPWCRLLILMGLHWLVTELKWRDAYLFNQVKSCSKWWFQATVNFNTHWIQLSNWIFFMFNAKISFSSAVIFNKWIADYTMNNLL